jgi:predicted GNAT superfamily acetyltransferase
VAGSEAVIEIRPLSALAEFAAAVSLQQRIWGFADIDVLPVRFFVVASRIGGQVWGAYDSGEMVGFCLAVPGVQPGGRAYWHSHILGVLRDYRDAGVGRQMKLRQRQDALERGFDLVDWTFDPLDIKNAYFNIERLGAIVRRYSENQYGAASGPLFAGLPTDRCVAEWWIASPRVEAVIAGEKRERAIEERIAVPADMEILRRDNPQRAREIQQCNAERFQRAFQQGLAVTGFERTEAEGVYLLERWP